MGRHDLALSAALKGHSGLAAGIYAQTPILTASGWLPAQDLAPGDLVVTLDHGLSPIVALRPQERAALWSVRLPEGALGNPQPVILPPGQPVLLVSAYAIPFTGETTALVPAAALEGWRGIAPHVPACRQPILQIDLARPALVQAGPGLVIGLDTIVKGSGDLMRLFAPTPDRLVLPLPVARHLVAALVAEETGRALRAAVPAPDQAGPDQAGPVQAGPDQVGPVQAARDRPAKRA